MTTDKIQHLINTENEEREEQMLRQARNIIREISHEQQKILDANKRVEELRAELKSIETSTIDATSIIG